MRISFDDLSAEIVKHDHGPVVRHLLALLCAKRIDLKQFCRRVKTLVGVSVLVATVKGLQAKQRQRLKDLMRLWRGLARCSCRLARARDRAAERAYAPHGLGFAMARREFESLASEGDDTERASKRARHELPPRPPSPMTQ